MSAVDVSHGDSGDASHVLDGEHDVRCGRAADRHAFGGEHADAGALGARRSLPPLAVTHSKDALRKRARPDARRCGVGRFLYLMYLEVTRWHHVKPSLAFNSDIAPKAQPGLPLILLYVACVAGPLMVLTGAVVQIRARRTVR
jgi:hypothetical protein